MLTGFEEIHHWVERERRERTLMIGVMGSGMSNLFDPSEFSLLTSVHPGVVEGHPMNVGVVERESVVLVLLLGRRHLYEGFIDADVTDALRGLLTLRPEKLLLFNAAGGLNPSFRVGDVMYHTGYISPQPMRQSGKRFRPLRCEGVTGTDNGGEGNSEILENGLRSGVYAYVHGPSYETRAEIRMLRLHGADAVGMSTIHEVALANARGVPTSAYSLITNMLTDTAMNMLDHDDVTETSRRQLPVIRGIIDGHREMIEGKK